jgi:hypothetical protein
LNTSIIAKSGDSYTPSDVRVIGDNTLKLLIQLGVDTNKLRISYLPSFKYDVTSDIVNPDMILRIPVDRNGLFIQGANAVNLSPNVGNLIEWKSVITYEKLSLDDFKDIVDNSSTRGVVVYISLDNPINHFVYNAQNRIFDRIRFIEL